MSASLQKQFPDLAEVAMEIAKSGEDQDFYALLYYLVLSDAVRFYAAVHGPPGVEVRDRLAGRSPVIRVILSDLEGIERSARLAKIDQIEKHRPRVGRALRNAIRAHDEVMESLLEEEQRSGPPVKSKRMPRSRSRKKP